MMLDEKILSVLRKRSGDHVSSDELCRIADISRAAIWKHVEKLRTEGYEIDASPHLGYRLIKSPDILISSEVKWQLRASVIGREVIAYKKVDSTNNVAYSLAEKGLKEGAVITADEQDGGKGRHGRLWTSPEGSGIYFSFILRPKIAPNEIPIITLLSAVAVAEAIRKTTGLDASIKWPNDILIRGKKVCGILTEMRAEQDSVDFVVVGIGVNVTTDLKHLPKGATSIKEEVKSGAHGTCPTRVELAKAIIERLEKDYNMLKRRDLRAILDTWRSLSAMIGSRIKVTLPNRSFEGHAHDVDPDGALVVRLDSGTLEKVSSGDVMMIR